jgi:hypothetical protein
MTGYYENIEFNLSNGQTDYDLDANQADFKSNFGSPVRDYPHYLEVRTDQEISLKFNSASNHSITVSSTDSPVEVKNLEIRNVYLTNNSGSTAAVKLRFQL